MIRKIAFAVLATTTLGAGIGSSTALASVVDTTSPPDDHTASDAEQTMRALEEILRGRMEGRSGVGIVAGVVFPDGTTQTVAVGEASAGQPVDSSTVFEIGSITKVFTATLLADMVDRGEVNLDDPIEQLLPATVTVPSRNGREITLLDLATQTSGLPVVPDNMEPADPANPYADYTVEQLYEFLSGYELTRDIGSQFEYSNLGVGLLGHALALRAGVGYEELVRERILEPLGMTSTGITLTPEMSAAMASGHNEWDEPVPDWDLPTLAGAGALRSSLDDMLRFAAANLDSEGGSLHAAMAVAQGPRHRVDPETEIGLNWFNFTPHDRTLIWHNGATGGFAAFVGLDPATGTAIVVMSNSIGLVVDDIGLHVLDERLPLLPPIEVPDPVVVSDDVLERYVGTYDLAGETVTIARTADGLALGVQGQSIPLFAESETEFFDKLVGIAVTFQLDANGDVTGFVLHQEGQDVPATRTG
jgi:serine-type D-Ala-D-Ala carboxypeptidase/endopeptidase